MRVAGEFVGRVRELAVLHAAFADAVAGRGRLVLLVGEPGIGKTRIAEEFAAQARATGTRVAWGRCWEGDGAPAFWPWTQIVRTYVATHDAATVGAAMGAGATDIAVIVPEVRAVLHLPPAEPLEPEAARFRFFDSITGFLRSAAERQPLVLILDDLHRGDEASLRLLQFIARELGSARLLVLGTYRDTELGHAQARSHALGELAAISQSLHLAGLSETEVGEVIATAAGCVPSSEVVRALHAWTEGNPLFVTEMVRLLAPDGRLVVPMSSVTDIGRIPDAVREAIRQRLTRLSQSCQHALRVAAVIGRDFQLELLRPVVATRFKCVQLPNHALLDILDEAVATGILDRPAHAAGDYRFSHALTREVLYEDLATTERVGCTV